METYQIIRLYEDDNHPDHRKVIKPGVTLEEAQAHCNDDSTKEDGVWFDAYQAEND